MARVSSLLATLLVAAACATPTPYGPASEGGFGYSEQAIEANRYRVSYRANDPVVAEDGALRRAAELTLQNGYSYFTVISRDNDRTTTGPRSSVGIGGGNFGRRTGAGVGVNVPISGGSQRVTTRLEIVMGRGEQPDGPRTYDANETLRNLRGDFTSDS